MDAHPTVFISYSHDSPEHSERVLALALALRGHGVAVELDQFHKEEIVDWPRWCNEQTSRERSDFVLCVCTAEYRRRLEGNVPPERGKGVYWEGSLLDDDIYDAKGNGRILPLLFGNEPESSLPRFLRGWTHCRLREFALTDSGYEHVLRIVTGQARVLKNDLGPVPVLPAEAPAAPISPSASSPRIAPTRLTVTGKKFVGRAKELQMLDDALASSGERKINIVSLIGQGGEGKTAVVLEWYARRARHGWQGARRVFDWSFYSQGTNAQSAASADEFFGKAFAWFGHKGEVPRDPWTKGETLAGLIAAERTLLVLDGVEPLQQPPGDYGGEFKDPAMKALLRALALRNPGLCVLTSRTDITDLKDFEHADGSCLRHPLHALDADAARHLLRELGVRGPDPELDEAIVSFKGHAYDMNLLGNYLAQCTPDHEIRRWKEILLLEADGHVHGKPEAKGHKEGHGRRMLRAYERWLGPDTAAVAILRLLGLFDRPARSDLLDELRAAPVIPGLTEPLVDLPGSEWLRALDQLQGLGLIAREEVAHSAKAVAVPLLQEEDHGDDKVPHELRQLLGLGQKLRKAKRAAHPVTYALDAHPLLREHFAAELKAGEVWNVGPSQPVAPEAAKAGSLNEAWRAAHRRLYEYLRDSTPDLPQPTLDDLQPLYQAVAHGCKAGLQQEACDHVYFERIHRRGEAYGIKKLGAFGAELGAVACFFEQPWTLVSPSLTEADQAWLLNEAAFRLRALGRLNEALEPMRLNLTMRVEAGEWQHAPSSAGNLSELELTLGEVAGAVGDAEQSVTYADRSGDPFQRMSKRATLADALYQAGRRDEAEARFREAEGMQAKSQPEYPLLYSLQGFRYCDLLLAGPERGAAREREKGEGKREKEVLVAVCRAVEQRAAQTLKWVTTQNWLLDIALDYLTLGRAALYRAILERSEVRNAKSEIEHAVAGLRRAGTTHHLPRGLLTRAWLRFLEGNTDGARADLDEAWQIAERGSMRLHMADIHLHRARLFREKEALRQARVMIERCGYWRRKEELEDAEEAAKTW